jgi:hypothetical protein
MGGLLAKMRRRVEQREAERDRRFARALAEALHAKHAEERARLALALERGELATARVAPIVDWSEAGAGDPLTDIEALCRRLRA